jgi:hypothetical protein
MRVTMRLLTAGLAACFVLVSSPFASAQNYAPTTQGLRQLVADDAAMLPAPYAAKLRKQEADREKGIGVTCTPAGNGQKFCYPDAKAMIQTIQAHIFRMDGYLFDDEEWSASFPLSPEVVRQMGGYGMPGTTPIRLDQNIPQIVVPLDAGALAFNVAVRSYAELIWMKVGGPPQTNLQADQFNDVELGLKPNKFLVYSMYI